MKSIPTHLLGEVPESPEGQNQHDQEINLGYLVGSYQDVSKRLVATQKDAEQRISKMQEEQQALLQSIAEYRRSLGIEDDSPRRWISSEAWASAASVVRGKGQGIAKVFAGISKSSQGYLLVEVDLYRTPSYFVDLVEFPTAETFFAFLARLMNAKSWKGDYRIAFDAWCCSDLEAQINEAGAIAVPYPRTGRCLHRPMQAIPALIDSGLLTHCVHRVLTRHVESVVTVATRGDRLKPRQMLDGEGIDAAVAMIMAMGLAIGDGQPPVVEVVNAR